MINHTVEYIWCFFQEEDFQLYHQDLHKGSEPTLHNNCRLNMIWKVSSFWYIQMGNPNILSSSWHSVVNITSLYGHPTPFRFSIILPPFILIKGTNQKPWSRLTRVRNIVSLEYYYYFKLIQIEKYVLDRGRNIHTS